MMKFSDFIAALLNQYKDSPNPSFNVRYPLDLDYMHQELGTFIDQNAYSDDKLKGAIKWWEAHGVGKDDEYARLHVLLIFIDNLYKTSTIEVLEGDQFDVVVGKRFWDQYKKHNDSDEEEPVEPKTTQEVFPRLRVVTKGRIQVHYPPPTESPFYPNPWQNEESFRIGLSTFSGNAKTNFTDTDILQRPNPSTASGIYGFIAKGITPHDVYKKELEDVIAWARQKKLHVLLMPELSVCEEGRKILIREMEKDSTNLYFVIPGSFHCKMATTEPSGKAAYQNQTQILWNRPGSNVKIDDIPYVKTEAFRMNAAEIRIASSAVFNQANSNNCTYVQEDIECGNAFHLMITPMGIFGVAICKDVLAGDWFNKYRQLVDHFCVISMNAKPNYFLSEAQKCVLHGTSFFYANAHQLTRNLANAPTETAFWMIPHTQPENNVCYFNKTNGTPPAGIGLKIEAIPQNGLVFTAAFNVNSSERFV